MSWLKTLCSIESLPFVLQHWRQLLPADTFDKEASHVISGSETALYLGTGIILPLLQDGQAGGQRSLRTLDSVVTSTALCIGLKQITQVKRPDSNERNSFPSCHAAAAFAVFCNSKSLPS